MLKAEPFFIVEGLSDRDKLRLVQPDLDILVLRGFRFTKVIQSAIRDKVASGRQPIILTDPDPAGDLIAANVSMAFPTATRLRADPEQSSCLYGTKMHYGIEYCSVEYLRKFLADFLPKTGGDNKLTGTKKI